MSRISLVHVLGAAFASVLALSAGCTRDNPTVSGVGGGGPVAGPSNRTPCASNADCGGGQICTTIGCCPGCHSDADCASDSTCVAGSPNFCAPKSTTPTPPRPVELVPTVCSVDSDCLKGSVCNVGRCQTACTASSCGANASCVNGRCYASNGGSCGTAGLVLCTTAAQCGTGRSCVAGSCAKACQSDTECGLGQACSSGSCLTQVRPLLAQCLFDADCGVSFRCINAACHPLCATDEQCGANNLCDQGVCRANIRPTG